MADPANPGRARPAGTPPFSDDERQRLAALAALIIPASAEYGVPGADDPAILDEILQAAAPRRGELLVLLQEFARLAERAPEQTGDLLRQSHPAAAALLQDLVAECYYRDARVMRSLGMEARPPFPLGHKVEQGDWSLLDPVRKRPPLWRETS